MRIYLLCICMIAGGYAAAMEKVVKPTLIKTEKPFSSSGVVEMSEMQLHSRVDVNKTESGSLNGVAYRFYYTDGSGTFAGKKGNNLGLAERMSENWSTRCIKDAMDDSVICMATLGDLTVSTHSDGSRYVVIGGNHYPQSEVLIRIDGGKPISAPSERQFRPPASEKILSSIKNGTEVTTRYQEWPYERYIDKSFTAHGFEEVVSYLSWAIKHIE